MAYTTRSTLHRRPAPSPLAVASFQRTREARRPAPRPERRPAGAAALRDPRGDLQMFEPAPGVRPAAPSAAIEELRPLLPPVVSEPSRPRPAAAAPPARRSVATAVHERSAAAADSVRRPVRGAHRPRLTRRGYTALLGVVVGSIAGTSALTLAQADSGPSVAPTQVVVRSGESLEQVASRAAYGRDVADVAAAIRLANDLPTEAPLHAGDVVVVPGS